MKFRGRHIDDSLLLVAATLALMTAATLVGYLEHRADDLQRRQNRVITQQICERTATVLAGRIRRQLDVAVLETIEGIGHRQITDDDVPRVVGSFAEGVRRHPYVDRFFLWSANRSGQPRDEVVFYSPDPHPGPHATPVIGSDGKPLGTLVEEPDLGREIMRLARAVSGPRTFLVVDETVNGVPYQVIVHLLWRDDERVHLFSIIGYTVNLLKIDDAVLHRMLDAEVRPFLDPVPNSPRLAVALFDDSHRLAYGEAAAPGAPLAATPVDMNFFPGGPLTPWLAGKLKPREWQLVVSTASPISPSRLFGGWLVSAVVLLILIAALCAVAVLRQSQRLSLMQADFVANVSHQLKTPLSLLSTAIETLRLGRVPADRFQQYLEILSSQTMRMTALIERILHFSRLDSDPEAYRMEPVNLVPLVGAVVDRFKTGDRQQIPVAFAPASAAVVVRADAHAIEQVVANLLENAVKYGDERNSVEVSVARSNGSAAISVRDHGIGIHHDDLPYIFDKFYRGRTGDQGRPGFGLGLALVQSIARAHGGRATVRTEYNAGSEFTLIIPAIAEDAADAVSDTRH